MQTTNIIPSQVCADADRRERLTLMLAAAAIAFAATIFGLQFIRWVLS